jgi:hypothetical protein
VSCRCCSGAGRRPHAANNNSGSGTCQADLVAAYSRLVRSGCDDGYKAAYGEHRATFSCSAWFPADTAESSERYLGRQLDPGHRMLDAVADVHRAVGRVLIYPPAAPVVVPLFTFIWIVYYLKHEQRRRQ